jgi:pimeloyl-ACP methyl ester carboxylesterase
VTAATEFRRETLTVNGVSVVMLTAGSGDPLVVFHGAGTSQGFNFALPWTSQYRVMIPDHPGWGDSGDLLDTAEMHDYVLHYLELFDLLRLERVNLIGFSMGGHVAARFAIEHRHRLRKLVLVAPSGLEVPEYPMADLSRIPITQLSPREHASFLHVATVPTDARLPRWLHRLTVPTLLMWGEKDRMLPVGQAEAWASLIPGVVVRRIAGAGHLVLDEKPEAVEAVADFLRS